MNNPPGDVHDQPGRVSAVKDGGGPGFAEALAVVVEESGVPTENRDGGLPLHDDGVLVLVRQDVVQALEFAGEEISEAAGGGQWREQQAGSTGLGCWPMA